jgi:pimeloyl-ACP methyl ester carboxylesterase
LPNSKAASYKIEQPVIFMPGTLCDERVFNACWQHVDIPMRAFVPLQWAEDLTQMKMLSADRLAYFEQKVHLVGFSMGGHLAASTALENPNRIASLTLIGSSCNELPEMVKKVRKHTLQLIKNKQYKGMTHKYLASLFHSSNQHNAELKNIVQQMELDLGSGVLAAQYLATQDRQNLLSKLAKAKFSVNLFLGEADSLVDNETIIRMHKALPNSNLTVVAGAGHMLPIEQPLELAKLLAEKIA